MECFITQRSSSYYSQYVKEYLIASQHDKAPNILHEPLRNGVINPSVSPDKNTQIKPRECNRCNPNLYNF